MPDCSETPGNGPTAAARSARVLPALVILLAACAAGCVGYRDHYDPAADRYQFATFIDRVGKQAHERTKLKARCVVNVACYVGGELARPVSAKWPELEALALRTVRDMRVFEDANIGGETAKPDYLFTFDIRIDVSREPGCFSGLILPFYKVQQATAKLQVLDGEGEPFADYVASSSTLEVRHILLIPLMPFYWPGWAESRARRNLFEALAVKLITDRKEFL